MNYIPIEVTLDRRPEIKAKPCALCNSSRIIFMSTECMGSGLCAECGNEASDWDLVDTGCGVGDGICHQLVQVWNNLQDRIREANYDNTPV